MHKNGEHNVDELQTENTGHCDGLMHKNGEHNVDEFVCAESRHLFVCSKSSASA
jgi:hypothetical protein